MGLRAAAAGGARRPRRLRRGAAPAAPEGGPVALVDVADEFFVALRLTPSGDLRVLLSDITAAEEWDLARQALDLVGRGELPEAGRPGRGVAGR